MRLVVTLGSAIGLAGCLDGAQAPREDAEVGLELPRDDVTDMPIDVSSSTTDGPLMCDAVDMCADMWLELTLVASDGAVVPRFRGQGFVFWQDKGVYFDCRNDFTSQGVTCTADASELPWRAQGTINVPGSSDRPIDDVQLRITGDDGAVFDGVLAVTRATRSTNTGVCSQLCDVYQATVTLSPPCTAPTEGCPCEATDAPCCLRHSEGMSCETRLVDGELTRVWSKFSDCGCIEDPECRQDLMPLCLGAFP